MVSVRAFYLMTSQRSIGGSIRLNPGCAMSIGRRVQQRGRLFKLNRLVGGNSPVLLGNSLVDTGIFNNLCENRVEHG